MELLNLPGNLSIETNLNTAPHLIIFVFSGESAVIAAGNLSIETNLNTAAHLIVFQILEGPTSGDILLEEKPTQLFTVEGRKLIFCFP